MKKNIFLFLCLISILGLSSCNSDNSIEQTPTVIEQETSGYISFKYKDILYSSNYEVDGENYRYENPEVIAILNELQELPNLALLAKSDGSHEYFDSYEELCEKQNIDKEPIPTTRATTSGMAMATLSIYTRTKYRGDKASFTVNTNRSTWNISDLSTIGLDEQITSMKLVGESRAGIIGNLVCAVTFFEHKNFQGKSASFHITYPYIDFGIKDFANTRTDGSIMQAISLDDITSSIKFGF